jgi:hypothetical protein
MMKTDRVVVQAEIASTRPLPSRGGFAFSRDTLEQFASAFAPMPVYRNHSAQVVGTLDSVALSIADDGAFVLTGTASVDLPIGANLEQYIGRGFSLSYLERTHVQRDGDLVIGVDSQTFSETEFASIRASLVGKHVVVERYHQFAMGSRAVIVLDASDAMGLDPLAIEAISEAAASLTDSKDCGEITIRFRKGSASVARDFPDTPGRVQDIRSHIATLLSSD